MNTGIIIDLTQIPVTQILTGDDTPLAAALKSITQKAEADDNDEYDVAGFSNFV